MSENALKYCLRKRPRKFLKFQRATWGVEITGLSSKTVHAKTWKWTLGGDESG
jgi:hypothetical protein